MPLSISGQYRKDIDGLRAVAVLSVIFYHFSVPGFSGGYVGVDIFFVISGYLISGMLYKDFELNEFSFFNFYERRIRRIYPALLLVVLSTIFLFYLFKDFSSFNHFAKSLLTLSIFSSNFLFWREDAYFDIGATSKPLLHTWSLAIEEQFYLVWPILLLFLYKYKLQRKLVIILLFSISFVLAITLTPKFPMLSFYLLPTRAFELLLGAYAASIKQLRINSSTKKYLLTMASAVFLILPIFVYTTQTLFPGYLALIPCVGSFLVVISSPETNYFNKLLSTRWLVYIGLISYPLYLWHWPLHVYYLYLSDVLFEYLKLSYPFCGTLVLFLSTLFISIGTYRYVEYPVRKKTIIPNGKSLLLFFIIISFSIAAFATLGIFKESIIFSHENRFFKDETYGDIGAPSQRLSQSNLPNAITGYSLVIGNDTNKISYILWGDSQAEQLLPIFGKLYNDNHIS